MIQLPAPFGPAKVPSMIHSTPRRQKDYEDKTVSSRPDQNSRALALRAERRALGKRRYDIPLYPFSYPLPGNITFGAIRQDLRPFVLLDSFNRPVKVRCVFDL